MNRVIGNVVSGMTWLRNKIVNVRDKFVENELKIYRDRYLEKHTKKPSVEEERIVKKKIVGRMTAFLYIAFVILVFVIAETIRGVF
ncbi:hypothetical protein [Terribacillus saccharophilus]|uniref:hypothetical protein n=1 Tax=Terribacillus saccharophilus TaxID=361277 RepID=UPI002989F52D|nr:hypothetical protein [Terribacillus saccharophilus]MCM3227557.1 hypothetical protein [Terribacillus saccharophilus]